MAKVLTVTVLTPTTRKLTVSNELWAAVADYHDTTLNLDWCGDDEFQTYIEGLERVGLLEYAEKNVNSFEALATSLATLSESFDGDLGAFEAEFADKLPWLKQVIRLLRKSKATRDLMQDWF